MSIQISNYNVRKEGENYLIFTPSGKSLLINEVGNQILEELKSGKNISELLISFSNEIDANDLKNICEYLQQLSDFEVISFKKMSSDIVLPTIDSLDNVSIKGKQCATFGMPKRSCKSLPTGLISK